MQDFVNFKNMINEIDLCKIPFSYSEDLLDGKEIVKKSKKSQYYKYTSSANTEFISEVDKSGKYINETILSILDGSL